MLVVLMSAAVGLAAPDPTAFVTCEGRIVTDVNGFHSEKASTDVYKIGPREVTAWRPDVDRWGANLCVAPGRCDIGPDLVAAKASAADVTIAFRLARASGAMTMRIRTSEGTYVTKGICKASVDPSQELQPKF